MFQLDLRNNKSIYDQIVDKFKEQIMMGPELRCLR